MREINLKVYEIAGFEFDELEFEDGPPPIDDIPLDNSSYSIDQILTDQQVQSVENEVYKEEDFETGAAQLDKKAQKLTRRSGGKPVKAGGATRTNLNINEIPKESKPKSSIKSSKKQVSKKPNRTKKKKSRDSSNSKTIILLVILLIAAGTYFFQDEVFKLIDGLLN